MVRNRDRNWLCVVVVLGWIGAVTAAAPAPRLTVHSERGQSEIRVELEREDGTLERHLVATTDRPVRPGPTGWGPRGRAAFVHWFVADQRWASYSEDGGSTWSLPHPVSLTLRLRDVALESGQKAPRPPADFELPEQGRLFLVQFRTPSIPEWRDAVTARGGYILRAFPDNAHLVRIDPARISDLTKLAPVERVEPYHPYYRIERGLREWAGERPDQATNALQHVRVVTVEPGRAAKQRVEDWAAGAAITVDPLWDAGNVLELTVNRGQLRRLAAHDDVLWIDRRMSPESDMDLVRADSGADWLEFYDPDPNNPGFCGQGVRGEVMDTGLDVDHPDLGGALLHDSPSGGSPIHGTATYGIVFGDGTGDATATGLLHCPGAQGIFGSQDVSDRFGHTAQLRDYPFFASFQSNSWGNGLSLDYGSYTFDIDDIIWRLDIAVAQSQSNQGGWGGTCGSVNPCSPADPFDRCAQCSRPQAWAKNIISVGGIYHENDAPTADDDWCDTGVDCRAQPESTCENFSHCRWDTGLDSCRASCASVGPAADGRIKPDVHYWYDSIHTTADGGGYWNFGGTSASTPQVAGLLGLIVQMWSENVWGTNPAGHSVFHRQPHFSTLKALLINSAVAYPLSPDMARYHQGWGRPNVQVAKERAGTSFIVNGERVLGAPDPMETYQITVPASEPDLRATLVFPDPPGAPSASHHAVNDLDLRLISPAGSVYYGNYQLVYSAYSSPQSAGCGTCSDSDDTVENVFVLAPEPGVWTIEVEAISLAQDAYVVTPEVDATFSLVVTGGTACGNGTLDPGEQCDGTDFGGADCGDQGCCGGSLTCTTSCTIDTGSCVGCPACGDGTCDAGEDCTSCPADCAAIDFATCGNGICEAYAGENCLNCDTDCTWSAGGGPSQCGDDPVCCGSGDGIDPEGCGNGCCDHCLTEPAPGACCGDGTCEPVEAAGGGCAIDCNPPTGECGDGVCQPCAESPCDCPQDCGDPLPTENGVGACRNEIDDDCDGLIDCDDEADCSNRPACVILCKEIGDTCFDDLDCCESSCENSLCCLPSGSACQVDSVCCSGKCKGQPGNMTCK